MTGASGHLGSVEEAPAGVTGRHVRHNAVFLGADFALFLDGARLSVAIHYPAGVRRASRGAQCGHRRHPGRDDARGGSYRRSLRPGPPSRFARKLPFVLRLTLWERVPFLVLALVAFFLATPAPCRGPGCVAPPCLLITTSHRWCCAHAGLDADIVGRAHPDQAAGAVLGVANVLGCSRGLVGSLGTASSPRPCAATLELRRLLSLRRVLHWAVCPTSRLRWSASRPQPSPRPRRPMGTYLRRDPRRCLDMITT